MRLLIWFKWYSGSGYKVAQSKVRNAHLHSSKRKRSRGSLYIVYSHYFPLAERSSQRMIAITITIGSTLFSRIRNSVSKNAIISLRWNIPYRHKRMIMVINKPLGVVHISDHFFIYFLFFDFLNALLPRHQNLM